MHYASKILAGACCRQQSYSNLFTLLQLTALDTADCTLYRAVLMAQVLADIVHMNGGRQHNCAFTRSHRQWQQESNAYVSAAAAAERRNLVTWVTEASGRFRDSLSLSLNLLL